MRRAIRAVGVIGLGAVIAATLPHNALRKDFIVLKIATQSGAPGQVRLTTRGLMHVEARQAAGRRLPWQTITKHLVPAQMSIAGQGEAFIASLDSSELVIVVRQIRTNPAPEQRLTGRTFRVTRQGTAPFQVTVIPERVAQLEP